MGVVGAGTMGSGIAQIAAQAGCEVILVDSSAEALQRSQEKLAKVFARLVEKGRIASDESESVQQRITRVTTLESLAPCDMVIEAIVEDLDIKTTLFQSLEGMVSEDAVLATNTSSLSVTALARGCTVPNVSLVCISSTLRHSWLWSR